MKLATRVARLGGKSDPIWQPCLPRWSRQSHFKANWFPLQFEQHMKTVNQHHDTNRWEITEECNTLWTEGCICISCFSVMVSSSDHPQVRGSREGYPQAEPPLLFTLKLVSREPVLNFEDYKLYLKLSETCDQGALRNSRNSYFGKCSRVDQVGRII